MSGGRFLTTEDLIGDKIAEKILNDFMARCDEHFQFDRINFSSPQEFVEGLAAFDAFLKKETVQTRKAVARRLLHIHRNFNAKRSNPIGSHTVVLTSTSSTMACSDYMRRLWQMRASTFYVYNRFSRSLKTRKLVDVEMWQLVEWSNVVYQDFQDLIEAGKIDPSDFAQPFQEVFNLQAMPGADNDGTDKFSEHFAYLIVDHATRVEKCTWENGNTSIMHFLGYGVGENRNIIVERMSELRELSMFYQATVSDTKMSEKTIQTLKHGTWLLSNHDGYVCALKVLIVHIRFFAQQWAQKWNSLLDDRLVESWINRLNLMVQGVRLGHCVNRANTIYQCRLRLHASFLSQMALASVKEFKSPIET